MEHQTLVLHPLHAFACEFHEYVLQRVKTMLNDKTSLCMLLQVHEIYMLLMKQKQVTQEKQALTMSVEDFFKKFFGSSKFSLSLDNEVE